MSELAAAGLLLLWSAATWRAGSRIAPAVRLALKADDRLSATSILVGVSVNLLFVAYLAGVSAGLVPSTAVRIPWAAQAVSLLAALCGVGLSRWARATLGADWNPLVAFSGHRLHERGPYRFVRHPIYAGAILFYLGVAGTASQAVGFLAMGAQVMGYVGKTALEERSLKVDERVAYGRYMRATRWRLLPGIY
jgi:protein-S-isoprenylcysteine O-methyltransferase Ste14